MPISDDWLFDYPNKILSHIDGTLAYDTGAGRQVVAGEFIKGNTSGAIAKVLSVTGATASGTMTLTNVLGLFQDNETFEVLSELNFDGVTAQGGFKVGDTITDAVTGTMIVDFIEYNIGGVAGAGTAYGNTFTAFTNNSSLDVTGGATGVALADGVGIDNDAALTTTQTAGQLLIPGTVNTNNSVIIHYDAGTISIPEDAKISDATSGAIGFAQQVAGVTANGSIRIVDSNTSGGAWTNNNNIDIEDVIFYDTQVAGQVFQVGDLIQGGTSAIQARVLAVIDDGDSTGKLITAGKTGAVTITEDINLVRRGGNLVTVTKIAQAESTTAILATVAAINIPNGVINEQRSRDDADASQGGIYPSGSLNVVRSWNALYSYSAETFDDAAQMDDLVPLGANVKDQVYQSLNGWLVPDLSLRFVESGSFQDETGDNIFTNYQTDIAAPTIGNHGYFYDASNPTPQPDVYIVQSKLVLPQFWVEGNINVGIKTKTNTDVTVINSTVPALGQLVDGGNVVINARPYPYTYDYAPNNQVGGVASVSLAIFSDASNPTGQLRAAFSAGGAGAFTIGEVIVGATSGARGIVIASDTGATGNVDYVLKSTATFTTETIVGDTSAKSVTGGAGSNLVAGYSADIKYMIVTRRFTGGSTTGTFVHGEVVTQSVSGATGFVIEDDAGTIYIEETSGTFTGTNLLTGGISAATNTPTGTAAFATAPKDVGEGSGDLNYNGTMSGDITNANPRSAGATYEWSKYISRKEAGGYTFFEAGDNSITFPGNIYRAILTYNPLRSTGDPVGQKPGAVYNAARGWFFDKDTLIAADLQNVVSQTAAGVVIIPPNLQSLVASNLLANYRVSIYRSTGAGLETILRNEFTIGTVGAGNNQSADTTILLAAGTRTVSPLPSDVPDAGWLRILDPNDTGNYLEFEYSAVNRTTNVFTLASGTVGTVTGAVDLTAADNAHVVFVADVAAGATLSNTMQYVADIPLFGIARLKGYTTFRSALTFTATGGTFAVVRNVDNIVDLP